MRSKPVAFPLADLSITKTHSRPYTSNDIRIESQVFKPVPHHEVSSSRTPADRIQAAAAPAASRSASRSSLGTTTPSATPAPEMMTPAMVHYGQAPVIRDKRQTVPGRSLSGPPRALRSPASGSSSTSAEERPKDSKLRQLTHKLRAQTGKTPSRSVSKSLTRADHGWGTRRNGVIGLFRYVEHAQGARRSPCCRWLHDLLSAGLAKKVLMERTARLKYILY